MPVRMDWNFERIERLKDLCRGRFSASWIAKQLGGVSRNAVIGKMHRLGLVSRVPNKGRPKSAEERKKRRQVFVRPPAPVIQPEPVKIEPRVSPEPLHLVLNELQPHHCRWPYGNENYTFCGHQRGESSYCAYHQWLGLRH